MKKLSGLLFIALLLMATTAFASSDKVKRITGGEKFNCRSSVR